jgi:hypothetical protein
MAPVVASVSSVEASNGAFVRSTVASVIHPDKTPNMKIAATNPFADRKTLHVSPLLTESPFAALKKNGVEWECVKGKYFIMKLTAVQNSQNLAQRGSIFIRGFDQECALFIFVPLCCPKA